MSCSLLKPSVVCFFILSSLALATAVCPEDPPAVSQLMSIIGRKLLEYSVHEAFPTQLYANVTRELNEMGFQEMVCSYFEYYHSFYWHSRHLSSRNNTEHTANTALLTFLLKRSTKSSCEHFKSVCAGAQVCSVLECDVDSIATLCLGLPAKTELVQLLQPPTDIPTEGRPMLVQLWMQTNLSSRNLRDGLFDSLAAVLEQAAFIRCTVPNNSTGTADQINCNFTEF